MWRKQSEFEDAQAPNSKAPSTPPTPAAAQLDSAVTDAAAQESAGEEPSTGAPGPGAPSAGTPSAEALQGAIVEQLKTVFDPEIPVNIYELGLIYDVSVADDGKASIRMTLTTPMCPAAEELPPEVESKARGVEGVTSVQLDLVWDPPWSPDMMSEAARLDLGMV